MLIAHVASGYVVAKALRQEKKPVVISSLIFSVWPDFGLIYFYLFDNTVIHRYFFPHLPVVMASLFLITLPLYRMKFFVKMRIYYVLFFVNWLVRYRRQVVWAGSGIASNQEKQQPLPAAQQKIDKQAKSCYSKSCTTPYRQFEIHPVVKQN